VSDIYCDLILRFAKTINSASATLFKAKLSPWAKGAAKKPGQVIDEPPEELEVEPKKLEWIMTPELKLAVVSRCPTWLGLTSKLRANLPTPFAALCRDAPE
jgi:hypothetical protein